MTLVPAYGRDYKSQKEVKADWDAGKDFQIADISSSYDGAYTSKNDASQLSRPVMIRYKKLTQICVVVK